MAYLWKQILVVAAGWTAGTIIGWAVSTAIYDTGYVPAVGIIYGLVGG